jgi:hypothetical protein
MRRSGELLCPPSAPTARRPPRRCPRQIRLGHAAPPVPYLWQYKWRVLAALAFMVGAKLANVGVPLLLKTWWTP